MHTDIFHQKFLCLVSIYLRPSRTRSFKFNRDHPLLANALASDPTSTLSWIKLKSALWHLRGLSTVASERETFFRYTSGTWLHDRERHEALRYRRFDIDALKEKIKQSTGGLDVVGMSKLAEGRSNKVFRVQLAGGREVIARIPMPLAGPQHLVTASEAATMTFLRDRLGLKQVPRVISWSSRASETPVGAEFMIMDVADGIELARVWSTLTTHQKINLILEWVRFEKKVIQAFKAGGYGSLYFRHDIPSTVARDVFLSDSDQPDPEYVLGPCVLPHGHWEEEFTVLKDFELNPDPGPWPDVLSYIQSLTNRERFWINRMAKPPTRKYTAPWEPPPRLRLPEKHVHLLDLYDKVSQYLIPPDQRLLRPTMTLLDSNMNNIFLSQEALARGEIEISAVIDWQHTAIRPLYLNAIIPYFIRHSTPNDGQDEEEFSKERNLMVKAYHALYADTGYDRAWATALSVGIPTPTPMAMTFAAETCWHTGYADLRKDIIRVTRDWQQIAPGVECPITERYTEQDLVQAREDQALWDAAEAHREAIEEEVGLMPDGFVMHDHYDANVQANQELFDAWKASIDMEELDGADPAEIWPVGRDSLKRG